MDSVAAPPPPCHPQIEMPVEAPSQDEECPACEISQDAWEQPLVLTSEHKITVSTALPILTNWEEFLATSEPEIVFSAPDPPDNIGVWHAELIVKNSTIFVI